MEDELLTIVEPNNFSGPKSAEVQHTKSFENTSLVLNSELGVDTDSMTVMRFYHSIELMEAKAKAKSKSLKDGRHN